MNNQAITYGRAVLPLILHLLIFQHVTLINGWWYLGFYLLGLLLLPLQSSPIVLLLVSALYGAMVDFASIGGGLFMSSALIFGWSVPLVNRLLAPREGYESTDQPTVSSMGIRWFCTRAWLLLMLHHLWMFTWEAGRWGLIWTAWGKAFASATFTTAAFALIMYLTINRQRVR